MLVDLNQFSWRPDLNGFDFIWRLSLDSICGHHCCIIKVKMKDIFACKGKRPLHSAAHRSNAKYLEDASIRQSKLFEPQGHWLYPEN